MWPVGMVIARFKQHANSFIVGVKLERKAITMPTGQMQMTKSRIEQAKAIGQTNSALESFVNAHFVAKAVIMRKQVRNAEGILLGINSTILCKCGNLEALKFFPLKKQPEKDCFWVLSLGGSKGLPFFCKSSGRYFIPLRNILPEANNSLRVFLKTYSLRVFLKTYSLRVFLKTQSLRVFLKTHSLRVFLKTYSLRVFLKTHSLRVFLKAGFAFCAGDAH